MMQGGGYQLGSGFSWFPRRLQFDARVLEGSTLSLLLLHELYSVCNGAGLFPGNPHALCKLVTLGLQAVRTELQSLARRKLIRLKDGSEFEFAPDDAAWDEPLKLERYDEDLAELAALHRPPARMESVVADGKFDHVPAEPGIFAYQCKNGEVIFDFSVNPRLRFANIPPDLNATLLGFQPCKPPTHLDWFVRVKAKYGRDIGLTEDGQTAFSAACTPAMLKLAKELGPV